MPINRSPLRCVSSLSPSFLPPPLYEQNLCAAAMLSALPPSDPLFSNPFLAFDGVFMPWEAPELLSSFKPKPKPTKSDQTHAKAKPASDDPKRVASVIDERKRRRMISNRESARRSRMRKQKHLENLRNQLNRFRRENRELNNRLKFLLHHCNRVRTENDWLRSERTLLCQKLSNITQILVTQQFQPLSSAWPCNPMVTTE